MEEARYRLELEAIDKLMKGTDAIVNFSMCCTWHITMPRDQAK